MKVNWISARNAKKLKEIGIHTTEELLLAGNTAAKRAAHAKQISVTRAKMLQWVQSADMCRVNGIGDDYLAILNHANVYTLDQLAAQEPTQLFQRISTLNATYRLVKRIPSGNAVAKWVAHAQTLDRIVNYDE